MKRLFVSVIGLVLSAGSLGLLGSSGASASATPTMTVTPNTGLTANQEVTIAGSGFAPNAALAAVECIGTATTTTGCDLNAITPINVSSTGTVSVNFYVQTGPIGNGTCGTSATDLNCAIAIGTLAGTLVADAPITFAAATTGPAITVTPSTGLKNGDKVTITGSGFTAGDSLFAVECLATATSAAGCNTAGATPVTVNADGTLPSTTFTVSTGTIGSGTCGTTASDLAGCVISVSNPTGGDAAHASITFAALASPTLSVSPSTGLKNGEKVTITGSGFTAGDSLFAVECLATATSAAGCNTAGATPITANSDGTLPSTTFTVTAGTIGSGACGTKAANARACVITVATAAGTDAGAAPIQFAVAKARVVRTLFVRPTFKLHNGQVVTVFGHGFIPRDHVYIVECLAGASGAAGCDLRTLKAVTIRANGVLPATKFRVVTGKIGSRFCGTTRANLRACTISVANVHKGDSKVVRIGFRLP